MVLKKRIRIIKKIRENAGVWKFISLHRIGSRYVWDKRPGYFFIEWWEGKKRKRELAGQTPSEATEAQRRKQNELSANCAQTAKNFQSHRRVRPRPSKTPLPCLRITSALIPRTSPKPIGATRRCWNTSSGTLAKENSSKPSPAPTLTTSR